MYIAVSSAGCQLSYSYTLYKTVCLWVCRSVCL